MKNPIDRIYLFYYFLDFLTLFLLKAPYEKKNPLIMFSGISELLILLINY